MHGFSKGHEDDLWVELRKRREEWRARRHERRSAWRAARQARRAAWQAHWGDLSAWSGCGMDASPRQTQDLKAQVESMQTSIDKLLARVAVLEKLAVDGNDTQLAAEIEKLRGKDAK